MKRNNSKIKVNYVKWERGDAIGKVTSRVLENIRGKVDLNIITLKRESKNGFLKILKSLRNIMKILQLFFRDEIIHFEGTTDKEPILNIIFKHKKSILTVHHLEENNKKSIKKKLSLLKDRQKHLSFSKLIAVSEKTKEDLIEQYNINPSKITVVCNGINKDIFKPTSKKINFLRNKGYILYF